MPLPVGGSALSDVLFRIANGESTGKDIVIINGYNEGCSADFEAVWPTGGLYSWPTTATTMEALSTSANDTAAGSGARTVKITGLDSSFSKIEETVSLNGTSAVATTSSFIRVNRCEVITSGAYATTHETGTQEGDITVRVSGGGAVQAVIEATNAAAKITRNGICASGRHTTSASERLIIEEVRVTCEVSKAVDFHLYTRGDADTLSAPFSASKLRLEFMGLSEQTSTRLAVPIVVQGNTDVWIVARLSSGAPGTVNCSIQGLSIQI
jgi:hypothetical protein